MGKKLVMAQKRGETRALCLGVAMVVCAVIAYYILGTTMLPLYQKRYCTLLAAPPSSHSPKGLFCQEPQPLPTPPLDFTSGRKVWTILSLRVHGSSAGRVGLTGPCSSGVLGPGGGRHRRPFSQETVKDQSKCSSVS